jgi:hypothetical protein
MTEQNDEPKRTPVEADYLLALAEICPPATWRDIVQRAVDDALAGDAKARAWLAKHLLPGKSNPLREIAVVEAAGGDLDTEIERAGARRQEQDLIFKALSGIAGGSR